MHSALVSTFSPYDTIILVGGGTGGHIQPILNLSEELKSKKLLWIGGHNSNEEKEAKTVGIAFQSISTLKLSTTKSPKVLLYPFILVRGIFETRKILRSIIANEVKKSSHKIDTTRSLRSSRGQKQELCVFSKGGPGSVAVGIAAWSLGIQLYIHESDTIPGRSNRILAHFATTVFLGFESAKKYFNPEKCEVIGQILSISFAKEVPEGRRISTRKQETISPTPLYKEGLNWKTDKKHLLVICGSQGARVIFEEIRKNLISILEHHEIILVLGKLNTDMRKDFEKVLSTIEHPTLELLDWIDQDKLAELIRDTDIAITRGSATTLAELTSFHREKPQLIMIPLPHAADNHQYYNALEYEKMGHILLEQKNISTLTNLLTCKNLAPIKTRNSPR